MRQALPIVLLAATLAACAAAPQTRPLPTSAPGTSSLASFPSNQMLVRLRTKSAAERIDLLAEGFDLFAIEGNSADAVITPKQEQILKQRKISYQQLDRTGLFGNGGRSLPAGYKTVDQVFAQLKTWATQHPDIVTLQDVGDTWEKQQGKAPTHDIWAMTIGKKAPGKPTLLVTSGVHARELAPVELSMQLAADLLAGYGKDAEVTRWLDKSDVVIVPVVNVDGRKLVERGHTMWRKNARDGQGVDLNRNFDAKWNYEGVPTPAGWSEGRWESFKSQCQDKHSDIYSGPHANSEPETQAIAKLYQSKKINLAIDLHAYGELMIWPLGYTTVPTPHDAIFRALWKKVAPTYQGGTSMQLLYPTSGTTKDYAYEKHRTPGFTIEVGTRMDGFRPDYGRVSQIWRELGPGLKYLVSVADDPAKALPR